jgi:hypothetical protein
LNITSELYELYATAKTAGKLDLAFRILACLAKMKPEAVSIERLSSDELTSIITECGVLVPDADIKSVGTPPSCNLSSPRSTSSSPRRRGSRLKQLSRTNRAILD